MINQLDNFEGCDFSDYSIFKYKQKNIKEYAALQLM